MISDTIPLPEEAVDSDLFRVLSVDRILADSVHNVFCDESVSAIFAGENQLFWGADGRESAWTGSEAAGSVG